ELLSSIRGERDVADIKNLAYRDSGGNIVTNEIRPLITDLDAYGIPRIGGTNKYFIDNDTIKACDPQASAVSYELSASRGCPFACTYCCSINLNRLTRGSGKYVRFRDVNRVIEELRMAKRVMKKLVVVHFWDEIFCDDDAWVDTFTTRYKKEIGLPFEIWGHPLKTSEDVISKLRAAGLYKVVMGIQSGSPYIRRDVFNRPEKQEEIIRAGTILSGCGVPQVVYDFMLRHPFETADTMRESFDLCMQLSQPFELQLHGLNFLPGTDIVEKAVNEGLVSKEDMDLMMNAPMQSQYDMHWKVDRRDPDINAWYDLIFLTQFPSLRKRAARLAGSPFTDEAHREISALRQRGERLEKLRYYKNKGQIVLLGLGSALSAALSTKRQ
ncbi:MAG: radical SAM protein, partial [Oscillospiraceae bacterium]|nr:radical SAM protein [Oscillospiraceae bacterium]